jgi:flagellin
VGETEIEAGNGAVKLTADKLAVDKLRIDAASNYNRAAWAALHVTNQVAGAKMELSYYQDVDFAAETSELAKHQIIAQAGTAMLAQANSQGQGILALLQD